LPQLPQFPNTQTGTPTEANTPAPVTQPVAETKDSVQTICNTAIDNELRGKALYEGKRLVTAANFVSLQDYSSYKGDFYTLYFRQNWKNHQDIAIFADSENKNAVLSLSSSKSYWIGGTIKHVKNNYGSCMIILGIADFPKSN